MPTVAELEARLDATQEDPFEFFDYQVDTFTLWEKQLGYGRLCLYYRTGAGKSITALSVVALRGYTEVLVVAPPSTTSQWVEFGRRMGLTVTVVSHAKYRQPGFKVSREIPLIADEFHQFGGHGGKGWTKIDRHAANLKAPLILCSATPNYNDVERCYCIQHVLDPASVRGGFLQFLYQHCDTEQNPFGQTPIVTGFTHYRNAEHYLSSLPYVVHVPDNVVVNIKDIPIPSEIPDEFDRYGLNRRTGRIMASGMEARHQRMYLTLVGEDGMIKPEIYDILIDLVGQATTQVLLYCNSSMVAEALHRTATAHSAMAALVTGKTPAKEKELKINMFRSGELDVLIGTATLATGTDGLDRVCDTLIIVNDTDDPSLRKQLVGRILPRGADVDASRKQLFRLSF